MNRGFACALVVVVAVCGCKKSKIGGPCSHALDCPQGTELCLKAGAATEGFCAKACTADSDCPTGLTCKEFNTVVTGGVHGTDTASYTEHYCK